ncbi:DUF3099 domain-containing protein [Microbacterium sp. W1N]|uniref:DUF3099 domain-containing protein n=1 Tax=Microbacterium festucae TaxID=2977531 RepID=UPI0021C22441|nr:DUF3099 domain-containing protein [Microbacterium festucae]MCT9819990.1 DUF3099 domain-containing protein [Microbacterium festucae]
MKHNPAQSATSLPRAPRDEAHTRMTKYFLMMSVRVVCFVLMVVITPYGWYTFVLAIGAVFLPYVAVVIANVGVSGPREGVVSPERSLPAAPAAPAVPAAETGVIRIHEAGRTPAPAPEPTPERDPDSDAS